MYIPKFLEKTQYLKEYKQSTKNPRKIQEKILLRIIKKNKNTVYGKKYKFNRIKNIEEFQKNTPLVEYKDIAKYIEKTKKGEQNILTKDEIIFFATTSGTTSEPKYLPVTKQRLRTFRKEFTLWSIYVLKNYRQVIGGKTLYFASNYLNGYTKGKIPHGNITGFLTKNTPWFIKKKLVITDEINEILDFDKKTKEIAKAALLSDIRQIAFASPVQAIIFFDYLENNKEEILKEMEKEGNKKRVEEIKKLKSFKPIKLWPNLKLINCIKTESHRLYLDAVKEKIGTKNITIRDPGIYSSEGRLTLGLTKSEEAGLIVANVNFFEFCEQKEEDVFGKPQTIETIKKGKKYKIIITTPEGLYRYDMGDVVEVVGFEGKLPLVKFSGRNKFLNIAEEHAPEDELSKSIREVLEKEKINFRSYTLAPYLGDLQEKPRYEIMIEANSKLSEEKAKEIAIKIDDKFQKNILTYKETRNEFGRMQIPFISLVKKGSYNKLDKEILAIRAQAKPINVTKDTEFRKKLVIEKSFF